MSHGKSLFSPRVQSARKHLNISNAAILKLKSFTGASEMVGRGTIQDNLQVRRKQNELSVADFAGVQANGGWIARKFRCPNADVVNGQLVSANITLIRSIGLVASEI